MWNYSYIRRTLGFGQMPLAGRQGKVQEFVPWIQSDHQGGGSSWLGQGLGTNILRLFSSSELSNHPHLPDWFLILIFLQGLFKFGLYEVFKVYYSNLIGEENSYLYRTSLYLAASASAEFFGKPIETSFQAFLLLTFFC